MKKETHDQLNAGMLCVIAFTIGLVLAFAGCATATKTESRILNSEVEFGGGLYLQKGGQSWK